MKTERNYELGYLPKIEYWTNKLLDDNCDPDFVIHCAEKIKYFTEREKERQLKLKNK